MDLEREMEALSREARKKLAEEGKREAEESAEATKALDDAREALEVEAGEGEAAGTGSWKGALATVAVALIGAWVLWSFVIAPLLKVALVVGVVAAIGWLVWKLVGGGGGGDPPD